MFRIKIRWLAIAAPLAAIMSSASLAQSGPQPAAPPSQASVPVPRDVLERYVGRYALNGTIATVSVTDDGRLNIELAGQPKGPPLRAVSANEFVADAAGAHIFFEGDGPKASRLRSQYAGSEVTGTRVADGVSPFDETLAPYVNAADSVALPDGRKLHIVCMGKGSPTIILTAGAGDFAGSSWGSIQPEMAKITRTCSWDRAGFGLSDGTTAAVTVSLTTADLEAALATGKIAGPYVMVGHSLGSYESLLFTDRHPDKVVGMVLVDPSIPNQFEQMRQSSLPVPNDASDPMAQAFRKCAADIRAGTAKAGGPDPDHCFDYPLTWPLALRQALAEKVSNPLQYEAMASFSENILVDGKQVINPSRNYRDMPLIVLTSDRFAVPPGVPPPTDEQKARRDAMYLIMSQGHAALAALSTRGVNTQVPGADHAIHITKPQAVLDAVAKVVGDARASRR